METILSNSKTGGIHHTGRKIPSL